MTRGLIMAAALGAFLGACTDVPEIDLGDCGNRVVEAGEDCDGFAEAGLTCGPPAADEAGKATACFFVCDPAADAPACPDGWECGADQRCREPTRTFAVSETTTLPFPVQEFAVGDVNGDGHADLVGNQSSQISLRLGLPDGLVGEMIEFQTPEPVAPLLFDQVDNDSLFDVIVPIVDGLFTLAGDARASLDPVPYASLALSPVGDFRAVTVEAFTGGGDRDLEILAFLDGGMVFFEADSNSPVALPAQSRLEDLGRDIAVGNIDGDALTEVGLAFDGENVVHICEGRVNASGLEESLQPVCTDTVSVTNPITAAGGAHFADVNGDGALDLLVSVTVDGTQQVEVVLNDGTGNFASAGVAQLFATTEDAGGKPVARPDTWPIAVADLDGNAADDYVFSKDVVLVANSGAAVPTSGVIALKAASDTWSSAAITDINGDDRPDVAVSLDRANRIDVFVNSRSSDQSVIFNKFTLNLDARPKMLRAGDFDGDLVGDVAFVLGEAAEKQSEQVAVSFGNTSGASSAAVVMGSLGQIEVLAPIEASLGVSDFDTITDLAVVFKASETVRAANVLRGDSSRRMISPLFLFNREEGFDRPYGVALGDFVDRAGEQAKAPDLFLIGEFVSDAGTSLRGWLLAGTGLRAGMLPSPDQPELPNLPDFDFRCALWRAGDLDGVEGDEVVGIDGRAGCDGGTGSGAATVLQLKITPEAFEEGSAGDLSPVSTELGDTLNNVRSMRLFDMNLDGSLDIVAMFEGPLGPAVVVLWNQGGAFDAERRTEIRLGNFVIHDAAPVQFGDDTPELLLLSDQYVFRAILEPGTTTYGEPQTLISQGGDGRLDASDINGDGLEDVVFTDGEDARAILQIPGAPLGSRDAASSAGGAQP